MLEVHIEKLLLQSKFHYFQILYVLVQKTKQKGDFWWCPLQPNALVKPDGMQEIVHVYDIPLSSQ